MAFDLNKDELAERDRLVSLLRARQSAAMQAIEDYNEEVCRAWERLDASVDHYNGAVLEANDLSATVYGRVSAEFDDTSDAWQRTDCGHQADVFVTQWTNAEFEMIDLPQPDMCGELRLDVADKLMDLPDTATTSVSVKA